MSSNDRGNDPRTSDPRPGSTATTTRPDDSREGGDDMRARPDLSEPLTVHRNEAEVSRRDRIRWGPVFAGLGSGLALGAFDPSDTFEDLVLVEQTDPAATGTEVTAGDAEEAAGWALGALTVALLATTLGAVLGSKMWPRDEEVDLRDDPRFSPSRSAVRR